MGPKTETLVVELERAIDLLRKAGDGYHADRIGECRALLLQSDFRGIGCVLTVFHAKGSLNDVARPPLGELSHEIYALADEIRRDVERDSRRE